MADSGCKTKISLNCSLVVPPAPSLESSHTPNMPEILNTIVDITHEKNAESSVNEQSKLNNQLNKTVFEKIVNATSHLYPKTMTQPSNSCKFPKQPYSEQYDSYLHGNELYQQHFNDNYCDPSQKMKDQLKKKVNNKIKDESSPKQEPPGHLLMKTENLDISLEDDIWRHRRRERNKVAATKCRNKKKEKQAILLTEGEMLEIQNISLKEEISRLREEKRRLSNLLEHHKTSCSKRQKIDQALKSPDLKNYEAFKKPFIPVNQRDYRSHSYPYAKEEDIYVSMNNVIGMQNYIKDGDGQMLNKSDNHGYRGDKSEIDLYSSEKNLFDIQQECNASDNNQSQFPSFKSCSAYDYTSPNYFLGNKFQHCFQSVGILGNVDNDFVAL